MEIATASNAEITEMLTYTNELLKYNNAMMEYTVGFALFAILTLIVVYAYKFLKQFF